VRNINFSIDGEQLKERLKEIDGLISKNREKCLSICKE